MSSFAPSSPAHHSDFSKSPSSLTRPAETPATQSVPRTLGNTVLLSRETVTHKFATDTGVILFYQWWENRQKLKRSLYAPASFRRAIRDLWILPNEHMAKHNFAGTIGDGNRHIHREAIFAFV